MTTIIREPIEPPRPLEQPEPKPHDKKEPI